MIRNINKSYFNLSTMNRKFIFSMTLSMSFILGSGFVIASQTALAVQFSYPYSSSSYNKPYSPHNNNNNNNISSSYDSASYNKPYSIYNNDKIDKYPDSYSISAEYSK